MRWGHSVLGGRVFVRFLVFQGFFLDVFVFLHIEGMFRSDHGSADDTLRTPGVDLVLALRALQHAGANLVVLNSRRGIHLEYLAHQVVARDLRTLPAKFSDIAF